MSRSSGKKAGWERMDERRKIRDEIRAARRRLDPVFVRGASARVQQAAGALVEWRAAGNICCYLAMPVEIQTEALVRQSRADGKQLFVPAYSGALRKYVPAIIDPGDEIGPGKFNILEPAVPRWIKAEKIDLVFVPGLAFDRFGGRLGHGGGYYDQFLDLESLRAACKVGLAFEFQMRARIPLRAGDVRMDVVITEKAVYRCANGRPR